MEVPEGVYLDPETKLMWTIEDNGKDINWHEANEYAKKLRLGGYSDWRLAHDRGIGEVVRSEESVARYNIRKPFKLTGWWVWSSTKEGSDSAWFFDFRFGRALPVPLVYSGDLRALCVRRSRRMMGHLVIGSFKIF